MHHGRISPSVAKGLTELRRRIADARIPSSKIDETLLLATWNIRELGKHPRRPESLHYIAEIIGQFDLVSIVEVRDDLTDLATVMRYLGPTWRVVFSDYIADPGGNRERVAFVYDERAARFTGLASTALGARSKRAAEYVDTISWWRPPFLASFQSGNFDFVILGAHVRWGDSTKKRAGELRKLAEWVASRQNERFIYDKDMIVVGDFNIPEARGALFDAVTEHGLRMPRALMGLHGSNLDENKRYDQILQSPSFPGAFTDRGGVLDFYCGDFRPLFPEAQRLGKLKYTFQLSDHLPLWIELNTDNDGYQLDQILNRAQVIRGNAGKRRGS